MGTSTFPFPATFPAQNQVHRRAFLHTCRRKESRDPMSSVRGSRRKLQGQICCLPQGPGGLLLALMWAEAWGHWPGVPGFLCALYDPLPSHPLHLRLQERQDLGGHAGRRCPSQCPHSGPGSHPGPASEALSTSPPLPGRPESPLKYLRPRLTPPTPQVPPLLAPGISCLPPPLASSGPQPAGSRSRPSVLTGFSGAAPCPPGSPRVSFPWLS